jgi:nicotinate-nucleotide pyrophosphorylase (carboxylating)
MAAEFPHMNLLRSTARELAQLARAEDFGERGDITSQLFGQDAGTSEYRLVARQSGVLAGCVIAGDVLAVYDRWIELTWGQGIWDGSRFEAGAELARMRGPRASVLAAERVVLNFLQRLCGVATATRTFVDAVAGTRADIYDTRKTVPGWRVLDKYAVCCGGGHNHRMGLHDAILIKDNHLAGIEPQHLAGAVFDMLNRAGSLDPPPTFVEVEADTLEQAEQLFKVVGVDAVLLDNFAAADLRKAVELRDSLGLAGKVQLEASGGVTLDTVRAIAETGVDRISVGAITHSVPALDLALEAV